MPQLRTWEWRQLHRTPLPDLARGFASFRAMGGTTVSLDLSHVVDLSEPVGDAFHAQVGKEYRALLTEYVAAAVHAGLSVEALAGSRHWIDPEVRYVTGIVAAFVRDFNATTPQGRRLVGLHFDLEPWGSPTWERDRVLLTGHLLATVAGIADEQRRTAPAGRVPVSIDLPFWLDGTEEPRTVTFQGVTASPTRHVMRLLDNGAGQRNHVVIMAYRDTVDGVDGSSAIVARELEWAREHAGRVVVTIGQEIGPVQPPWTTFHEEGAAVMRAAMARLQARYGSGTGFGGFAVNDFASLARALGAA